MCDRYKKNDIYKEINKGHLRLYGDAFLFMITNITEKHCKDGQVML